ncbi:NB-ARC domain protein [anaerobic digester metagenome]
MNGSYRVSKISNDTNSFNYLKNKGGSQKYPNGAYIFCNTPRELELIYTDPDLRDVYLPNGPSGNGFEVLSYLTGATRIESYEKYSIPPEELPKSETYGLDGFDVQGNIFSNMPKLMDGYIKRHALEEEISRIILDKRNPVITLSGRGGIGKTTILLSILHEMSKMVNPSFDIIIWFSARDIDLKENGPKSVQVAVLTKKDISEQYINLMQPDQNLKTAELKIDYFTKQLREHYEGKGKIYIFDNFETLTAPEDVYTWINTNIELPNKVIITTRHRKFKSDYPIEISGMTDHEAKELIESHAKKLNITNIITNSSMQDIIQLSDGHPYIIKIYLGQIAKDGCNANIKRVIADREDILAALFDRTFLQLSAAAQRVYLTLCQWNSDIPEVALKAILMRSDSTQMDIDSAIDEIINFSLIESKELENGSLILNVPLASRVYGEKKLKSSPYQYTVEDDIKLLHLLGARQNTETVQQAIERLKLIANGIIHNNSMLLSEKQNIIEYIGKKFPQILLHTAFLLRANHRNISKNYLELFLANDDISNEDKCLAWELMAFIYHEEGDGTKYIHAKTQFSKSCSNLHDISAAANDINRYISDNRDIIDTLDKKRILSSLAEYMEQRTNVWSADDYSRIAWLYMNSGNSQKAVFVAQKGIEIDPENIHCRNIISRQEN